MVPKGNVAVSLSNRGYGLKHGLACFDMLADL